jgi:hypothetical protein
VSKNIRQKISLPSVKKLGKETLCRVSKIKHSVNSFFDECFFIEGFLVGLDKELFAENPKKHAANHLALGKKPNSSSNT